VSYVTSLFILTTRILVCNLDYKSYHANCLKIENDTAYELESNSDWYCPHCFKDILPINFPFTDDPISIVCHCCDKIIDSCGILPEN
jgi:hypothetical protein